METGGTRSSLDVFAKVSTITWVKPKRDDDRNAHSTHHLVPRENVYPPHSACRLVDTSAKTPTRCLPPDNTGPSQGGSMVPSLADNAARSRVNSAPREIPNLGAPSRSLARSRLSGLRKQKKPAPPGQTRAPTGFRKTRTKDKYRVVYTDQQRLELEKEFHYTRYITIRRKSELAQNLQLSERQVKIWFQNRRAKDRKQKKKAETGTVGGGQSLVGHSQGHNVHGAQSMSSLLGDTKPKLEPSLHLSHLHQMSAMSMGMGSMGLHHHHPGHHPALHPHLGVPTSQHQLNQAAAAAAAASQVPPTSLSIM
ncbi:AGAP009646-PA-like protein [Anopheles sinensis]|uniref:AGAP009646-PA-like protein n=1 Tax=Anopheles sinensis TaxID=74873 RepID=A0A084WFW2_ANOSI|nr:AGAP009646-PA-like protein [Anopheles sinensis]